MHLCETNLFSTSPNTRQRPIAQSPLCYLVRDLLETCWRPAR